MPECHSTNSHALQLCQQSSSAPEGTIIITDNQTAGRGQRGNKWITEPGKNFTLSIDSKTYLSQDKGPIFSEHFRYLAIRDYLQQVVQIPVFIKWPNDILVKQ